MSLQHRSRGRPKGSGINDRQRLRDIATLISTQPQIKPTTAIKMLGEHDPSVIRRLRDKFYSLQHELMDEIRSGRPPSAGASAIVRNLPGANGSPPMSLASLLMPPHTESPVRANVNSVGIGAMPRIGDAINGLRLGEHATYSNGAQPVLPPQLNGSAPLETKAADAGTELTALDIEKAKLMDLAAYNVMLGLAIQATVSAIGHHTRVYEETLRLPPIMALLRQQIAVGEMVMSMTWPGGQPRGDMLRPVAN